MSKNKVKEGTYFSKPIEVRAIKYECLEQKEEVKDWIVDSFPSAEILDRGTECLYFDYKCRRHRLEIGSIVCKYVESEKCGIFSDAEEFYKIFSFGKVSGVSKNILEAYSEKYEDSEEILRACEFGFHVGVLSPEIEI